MYDKIFILAQVAVSALLFICAIAFTILQYAVGHITTAFGWVFCIGFIAGTCALLHGSIKQLRKGE